ncbi:hypothetical protein Nepgr_028339 [Nepenthes gracilis]|uniref:Uncharacterized protein n=1 Tax=Nepenthes gracilis TaxID=150966 RepID=A0AAD3TCX4_NEPGR|nr:hypothetical protein Nepgr_028339 [Nepenthes gracilis]
MGNSNREKKTTQPQPKAQTHQTRPEPFGHQRPHYVDTAKAQKNRNLNTAPTLLNLPSAPPSTRAKSKKRNGIQASRHIRQQTIAFRIPETTRDPGSLQMQPHEEATSSRQPIPPSTTLTHWSLEPRACE